MHTDAHGCVAGALAKRALYIGLSPKQKAKDQIKFKVFDLLCGLSFWAQANIKALRAPATLARRSFAKIRRNPLNQCIPCANLGELSG